MARAITASEDERAGEAALIAEIAPTMRTKLEKDGLEKGILRALVLIALSQVLQQLMLHSEFEYRFLVTFAGIAVAMVALAVLPIHFKKRSVAAEFRYRRQHGKWRWER